MKTAPRDDLAFVDATRAELTRLAAEAVLLRPTHSNPCSDKAPCRHCREYLDLHACIDDHLHQLFGTGTYAGLDLGHI